MLLAPVLAWALTPSLVAAYAFSANGSSAQTQGIQAVSQCRPDPGGQELARGSLRGVKKMPADEGEKFLFDYWDYDGIGAGDLTVPDCSGGLRGSGESETKPRSYPLRASLPVSTLADPGFTPLLRRDFKCPSGTLACTAINRPESCCGTGDTCQLIQDTGLGDVGCCPQGQTCSGAIGSCQQGYTSCPASLGGGCCIPGYECSCPGAYVYTVTITLSSTVIVSTATRIVPPQTTQASTSSSSSSTSSTSSGTTGEPVPPAPPARPTSLSTETTSQTSQTESLCPTGFYACSAFYQGGCCRTGRDCDTTSCPVRASSTITSNDRTIVVPAQTTGAVSGTGRCASGWFSCADTVGGGCCPSGFACGSSCTTVASASATGTVAKSAPDSAGSRLSGRTTWRVVLGMTWMLWI
ncbi:putative GPI anchored protein [Aspergillus clavatus NRRL 1]|uniref:GPI anchored protein, putative n=1 Tax=Aspergillus clavatus (strain ATCC 1007 / CBS 513.65 / DSM 816 / NCTC 3887 / NRRL 1 / QM 1276 / 107) TaxID=344612 RepID=A1CQE7_ASPCL|nr:GPI anchored protein, putative [Aspergillus clavatus NRRL 1]EAW07868.1 GPI anchored protein, putative [Aspergillus clavatus NRRL 1]